MRGPTNGSGSGVEVPPTTNMSQWEARRVDGVLVRTMACVGKKLGEE